MNQLGENRQFYSYYKSKRHTHVWDIAGVYAAFLFPDEWWVK